MKFVQKIKSTDFGNPNFSMRFPFVVVNEMSQWLLDEFASFVRH